MTNNHLNNAPHNLPVVDDDYQPLGLARWGSFEIKDDEVRALRGALDADGVVHFDVDDDEVREMAQATLRLLVLLHDLRRRRESPAP